MEVSAALKAAARELLDLIPLESTCSLPVPSRQEGRTLLHLFTYRRRGTPPRGPTHVYPPHLRITIDGESGRVVAWTDLQREQGVRAEPIGTYPHAAVADLSRQEREALQSELLALTDRLAPLLGSTDLAEADRAAARRYLQLFRRLTEPALRTEYEALNPEFFAWLQTVSA